MTARFDPDAQRILDDVNYAQLSTLMADGSPKVDSVWILREGANILIATDGKSIKAVNMRRDPRVALAVNAFDNPYEQVSIRGRVVEVRPDDDLAVMDQMSMKYLGTGFPRRRWSERLAFVIEPELARYYMSPLRDPRTTIKENQA
ncbi:PPOX class probable F420-dependent enzyme [Rhodococcus sp. OK519]|uniref:TIGR03618 family F420-dependent PPOX class oxidoreductase n=1 Tax=Rhodococcus sp. OK519 TaxID=2135729 RepID=UPI000D3C9F64|nr:PPOX class probable F420-dependent enzyme [Rhodococcus sp. OK519]